MVPFVVVDQLAVEKFEVDEEEEVLKGDWEEAAGIATVEAVEAFGELWLLQGASNRFSLPFPLKSCSSLPSLMDLEENWP